MIFKNAKTILFASLLMAMILPFSSMDYAEAEKSDKTLKILNQTIKEYKKALKNTDDSERKVYLKDTIKKLEIVKKIHKLSQQQSDFAISANSDESNSSTNEYNANSEKLAKLYNKLQPFLEEEESVDNVVRLDSQINGVSFTNTNVHYSSGYDCENRKTVMASAIGNLIAYDGGGASLFATFEAPSEYHKSVKKYRQTTPCTGGDHNESIKKYTVLAGIIPDDGIQSKVCTLDTSRTTGYDSMYCSSIDINQIILITSHFKYDASIELPLQYTVLVTVG